MTITDTEAPSEALDTAPEQEPAQAPEAPSPEPTATTESEPSIPDDLKPYVTKLREEAAGRRVALKPFEEAFSAYNEEERAALLSITKELADPRTQKYAAERLKALAEAIIGGEADPEEVAEQAATEDDDDKPLTRKDLERIEAEKKAAAEREAAIQAVINEAKELGYEENTPDFATLMWHAQFETEGDLKAAHEKVQARKQAIIEEYVKSVQDGKAKWPVIDGGGEAPATGNDGPASWAEARKAAEARAKAALGEI